MANRTPVVPALALVGVVAAAAGWLALRQPSAACAPEGAGLAAGAPWQLVAVFRPDCLAQAPGLTDAEKARVAMDMGYPSLVLRLSGREEALAALAAVADQGDRGFFTGDPAIGDALAAAREPLPEGLASFVRAAVWSGTPAAGERPDAAFLLALPIRDDAANRAAFVAWCGADACAAAPGDCGGEVSLADKLAVARGAVTPGAMAAQCPVTPERVLALRRAGLVDTACTATLQVNLALEDPARLAGDCYPAGADIARLPAISSADAIRMLRRLPARPAPGQVDPALVAALGGAWPGIAAWLAPAGTGG